MNVLRLLSVENWVIGDNIMRIGRLEITYQKANWKHCFINLVIIWHDKS
jgi:hypothetical protein